MKIKSLQNSLKIIKLKIAKFIENCKTAKLKITNLSPLAIIAVLLLGSGAALASIGIGGNIFGGGDSVNLQQGLVGHWKFDGNAKDSTPNGNHGVVNGATLTEDRFGNAGNAYAVDDTWVEGLDGSMPQSYDSFTLSAWIRTSEYPGYNSIIARTNPSYGWTSGAFQFMVNPDGELFINYNDGGAFSDTGTFVADGEWHLVTLAWDGSQGQFYVDGQPTGSFAESVTVPSLADGKFLFGRRAATQMFYGDIDDVRIYNRAINDAEVGALHEVQHPPSEIRVSDLQKGLAGHWGMDGNAKDSTPQRNHGSVVNGATLTDNRLGRPNSAYSFNGTNQYINRNNYSSIDYTKSYSMSIWVNPSSFTNSASNCGNQRTYIVSQSASSFIFVDLATRSGNTFYFQHAGSSSFPSVASSGHTVNQWYHLTGVYDDTAEVLRLFINGELVGTASTAGVDLTNPSGSPLRMGWDNHNCTNAYFQGKIDGARIYDRALSEDEIKQLHDSYRPVVQMSDLQKGLIGHWDMNGHPKDLTPYRNHGTVTGAALAADRHGRVNSAYEFDGTTAYIALGDLNGLFNDEATLSFWVKLKNAVPSSSGRTGITRFGTDSNSHYPWTNELAYFHTFRSARVDQIPLSSQIDRTTWHLVTITTQPVSNGWKLYQNTELIHQVDGQSSISLPAEARIGRSPATHYLDGYIDDVRLYNRALSADEIKMLHETYR